jgi:predicted ATPase
LGRNIFDQVNELEEFYNYIFWLDYIDTEFELKSWEKSLNELSPWEKWTLLLIFYLMIDEEWIPLIIDQPEDNLDNQSVFSMLSTFIKKAKKKRQIIIVTHNPNLAVWADTEQIIYTKIDKEKWNTFSFESGSIENIIINNHIVNILEWTMTAFDKRKLKYIKQP